MFHLNHPLLLGGREGTAGMMLEAGQGLALGVHWDVLGEPRVGAGHMVMATAPLLTALSTALGEGQLLFLDSKHPSIFGRTLL